MKGPQAVSDCPQAVLARFRAERGQQGSARARAWRRRAAERHGVALHQPAVLPGPALEPAGPLGRSGAADSARLLRPRERGAGRGLQRLPREPVGRRRAGAQPRRAAHTVPARLRCANCACGDPGCGSRARTGVGRPQGPVLGAPHPDGLRAAGRGRGRSCSSDHVL